MKKTNKKDKEENIKTCENCINCIYIGEGDFICDVDSPPKVILTDFTPTDEYWYCNGTDYESYDDEED